MYKICYKKPIVKTFCSTAILDLIGPLQNNYQEPYGTLVIYGVKSAMHQSSEYLLNRKAQYRIVKLTTDTESLNMIV